MSPSFLTISRGQGVSAYSANLLNGGFATTQGSTPACVAAEAMKLKRLLGRTGGSQTCVTKRLRAAHNNTLCATLKDYKTAQLSSSARLQRFSDGDRS